jgi:hypothetical protein
MPDRQTLVLSAALALAACTPTRHAIQPYKDDPAAARALGAEAVAACRRTRGDELPPYGFTTDGCSLWIDGPWRQCCVDHDMAYWCGGTYAQRVAADRRMRECVADLGHPGIAGGMYYVVRLGGGSWWPFGWRWGYGWDWPGQ